MILGELVYGEQDKSHIKGYISAHIRIKHHITHCPFPDAVEIQTYKVTVSIYYRAIGVSS